MNFVQSIESVYFKNLTNFKGRSSRNELINVLIFNLIFIFILITSGQYNLAPIIQLINFIPSLSLSIRRLHDINKSGWNILLPFTIIGLIPYWFFLFKKGDIGPNNYGENEIIKHYSNNN